MFHVIFLWASAFIVTESVESRFLPFSVLSYSVLQFSWYCVANTLNFHFEGQSDNVAIAAYCDNHTYPYLLTLWCRVLLE